MKTAVHFGAGNIGRGFVGLLLHKGGYNLVFSDINADLIADINAADSYTVHEAGENGRTTTVTDFRALNSSESPERVAEEIASADVVTTAVGPTVLRFIAPLIVEGLRRRSPNDPPLPIMACENAINATDVLRAEMDRHLAEENTELLSRAVFANTAVDRIVPEQPPGNGIDVTVEPFFEWIIEKQPFGNHPPTIPDAHFVDNLTPYIERKLFTVNTGHAAAAYFGARAGIERISDALAQPEIFTAVDAALAETSMLLRTKHELEADELHEYRHKILRRFTNPKLPDTVWRVGRQPLRKLSRQERFISPAAQASEHGLPATALLECVGAALAFDHPADEQSVQLQEMLRSGDARALTEEITGLESTHPLFEPIAALVGARQNEL